MWNLSIPWILALAQLLLKDSSSAPEDHPGFIAVGVVDALPGLSIYSHVPLTLFSSQEGVFSWT